MSRNIRSLPTAGWLLPRSREATYRHMSHGPIVPLEQPTFLERLFGRR